MDVDELDKTLKLFNGFTQNEEKRRRICNYIKDNKRISIFAYGSLLWNPIGFYDEFIPNSILNDYKKGFYCEDFIYRGTSCFSGLTMGLEFELNQCVHGALFVAFETNLVQFLKSFIQRESPRNYEGLSMDIYEYDFVEVYLPDKDQFEYSITCIVNKKSVFYLNNRLSIDDQAKKIGQAYGTNGTNFQYLNKLKLIYHKLNINDSFSAQFEDLYEKILEFRSNLTLNQHQWLQIYDQLQSLEENQPNQICLYDYFSTLQLFNETNFPMEQSSSSSS